MGQKSSKKLAVYRSVSKRSTLANQPTDNDIVMINTRSKWFNIALIVLCFCFLLGIRLQINQPTGGDEPGYLLMDYSLVHDHDLNLKNNYQQQSWLTFMPWLSPIPQGNPQIVNMQAARVYSPHGIGLPWLLFLGFLIDAKSGAVFSMVLLATLVVCLTWFWTKQVTHNRTIAYLAAGLLMICYFFTGLVGFMYPDMLIAALTLGALLMIENIQPTLLFQLLFGLVLGYMILAHYKTLDLAVPLLLVFGYKLWSRARQLPWLSTLVLAGFLAYYFLSLHAWFGTWSIATVYGSTATNFGNSPINNVSDMLFGSFRGLLVNNPIMLLIFVGLPLWFKKHFNSLLVTLCVIGPSILVLATYSQWAGGDSPIGRYVVEFLPALMPAVAIALEELVRVWQRLLIGVLAILTFAITLDNALVKFPPFDGSTYATRAVFFSQIQRHTGLAFDRALPVYSNATTLISSHGALKVLAGYVVVAGLLAYGYYLGWWAPVSKPRKA